MTNPHQCYPIYVPTKGRYNYLYTIRNLQKMNALFYAIVEEQEYELYAQKVDKKNLLVLDNSFKKAYQTLDNRGGSISYGSGPARNFAWQHAKDSKAPLHWVMDDNIRNFRIHDNNRKLRIYNTSFFRVMEQFVERYSNIAMAGPQYSCFVPRKSRRNLFILNTRIFSCNLIRTNLPYRWRGRYNEDTILSLDMLTDGWCTVLFYPFLQEKMATQSVPGGNTSEIYSQGTANKSRMLFETYPQYVRKVVRFGRPHHLINFKQFKQQLKREERYDEIVASQPPITFTTSDITDLSSIATR